MRRGSPKGYNGIPNKDFLIERAEPRRHKSKKDTKRRCGGHVGRHHVPYWETIHTWEYECRKRPGKVVSITQIQICFTCGKHMQYRWKRYYVINDIWTPIELGDYMRW